jgi:predicted enzyme related to lactoylglutathione lyase
MVTRDTPWPHGTPCWVDVSVDDVSTARLFYEGLFGWQIEGGPPEAGGYLMCLKDGRPAAGLGPKMAEGQPSQWTTYIAADDVDAVFAAIGEHGGQVIAPPMDVMDFGRMGIALDPSGASFGVWQAGKHNGAGIANEPGSLIWEENMSHAWAQNKDFYRSVFGWTYNDMSGPGFTYATFQVGGRDIGGLGELGDETEGPTQPGWTSYFAVDNTDDSVDHVVKLGGTVLRPPFDTPYGRMAVVADPDGASFAVISAPSEDEASASG